MSLAVFQWLIMGVWLCIVVQWVRMYRRLKRVREENDRDFAESMAQLDKTHDLMNDGMEAIEQMLLGSKSDTPEERTKRITEYLQAYHTRKSAIGNGGDSTKH